jgi:hypothetical protein
VLLGGVALLFPLSLLPSSLAANLNEWRQLPQLQAQAASGVALLASMPGPALCENLLMCAQAGKPSAFNPYYVLDQIRLNRIDAREITAMAAAQRFGAVEIGDTDLPEPVHRIRFTPAFLQALCQNYRIALRTPAFTIWVPAGR